MIIEFQKKCPKHRRKEIIKALWFAKDHLMPRVRKPIFINIRPIRNLAEKAGVYGDCMDEDDREFTIRIDTALPIEDMVSTLLHEMVHVQQYLSGRLKYKSFNTVVFEKAVYVYDMDYDSRPWEVEAWQKEQQLKDMYYGHYTN